MERRSFKGFDDDFRREWRERLAEYGGGFGPDDDVLAGEAERISGLVGPVQAPERPP